MEHSFHFAKRPFLLFVVALAWFGLMLGVWPAMASSHNEAPFIAGFPRLDLTDFYMFRSYETGRSDFIVLIACVWPLQIPAGGPNYSNLDPDAIYEIYVDNDGDAKENITFQFRFSLEFKGFTVNSGGQNTAIPLINKGEIGPKKENNDNLNVRETYTLKIIRGDRRTGTVESITHSGGSVFQKPVDNIGAKTFPTGKEYDTGTDGYARDHTYTITIPGTARTGRAFVGQRKDPFPLPLGRVFDLLKLTAPTGSRSADGDSTGANNTTRDKAITALVLEIPKECLVASDSVIGAWASTSVRQGRVINPQPQGNNNASVVGGAWTQIARLGMPLVNELIIGLPDKDRWNATEPKDDAQFRSYFTNPALPVLVEALFGASVKAADPPRDDLIDVFYKGLKDLNRPANVVEAEMLRLNTENPGSTPPQVATQNDLGVLGNDNFGYPNGRRPYDDVVDISLRVAQGQLGNNAGPDVDKLTDNVIPARADYPDTFPFLKPADSGSK